MTQGIFPEFREHGLHARAYAAQAARAKMSFQRIGNTFGLDFNLDDPEVKAPFAGAPGPAQEF